MFRAFYPKEAKYTFCSCTHGTFSRIDHMLGDKTSLNKFKETEILSTICSEHNGTKREINEKKKTWKGHTHER